MKKERRIGKEKAIEGERKRKKKTQKEQENMEKQMSSITAKIIY